MADAICGPSNPLQTFQKHTQADRSLQHDRLASQHAQSSQGFREHPADAGLLDPEFEAFQTGRLPIAPLLPHQEPSFTPPLYNGLSQVQPVGDTGGGLGGANWAADFAKMYLVPQAPIPYAQNIQRGPHVEDEELKRISDTWFKDTLRREERLNPGAGLPSTSPEAIHSPSVYSRPSPFEPMQRYGNTGLGTWPTTSETRSKGKERLFSTASSDTAAFDAEFAKLDQETTAQQDQVQSDPHDSFAYHAERKQDLAVSDEDFRNETKSKSYAEQKAADQEERTQQTPIENRLSANGLLPSLNPAVETQRGIPITDLDRAPQPALQQQTPPAQTPHQPTEADDQLAETASQLLSNVSDNTSEKFQQSAFLSLMRDFSDRSKVVSGDRVVDVANTNDTGEVNQDADLGRDGPLEEPAVMSGAVPTQHAHVEQVADQMGKYCFPVAPP